MFSKVCIVAIFTLLSYFSPSLGAAEIVDINKADAFTLAENLNGIGDAKARAIVAYRTENGDFGEIADLVKVKGIGNKLVERNRSLLVVGTTGKVKAEATDSSSGKTVESVASKADKVPQMQPAN